MNKVTKGTLAAAAAGALLLGGAGTYATWSDSTTIAGGVSTGHLTLSEADTEGWTYDGREGVVQSAVIVPGDTLSAEYRVTVNAAGDNIQGDLALTGLQNDALDDITVTYEVAPDLGDTNPRPMSENGTTYSFTEAGVYNLIVKVSVSYLDKPGQSSENAALDLNLSELNLDLTQTLKPKTA